MSFGQVTVQDGNALFHATISKRDQRGYDYVNQALNLLSGELVAWPTEFTEIPKHIGLKKVATVFGGESMAPSRNADYYFASDTFTGVLKAKDGGGYQFDRPEFYTIRPLYNFKVAAEDEEKFLELLDEKVVIRGKVTALKESSPPIVEIDALEISKHED